MKLELINFRSIAKASFDFDHDYTLISGPSGSGKTSIIMAIQFAISGEGKKIVKFGATKCSVMFETQLIKITRTKGPCRLFVEHDNKLYEDASAQAIIDRVFPNWELGYVSQKLYKSFILMTPADKLALIEKMALSGIDICAIQNRCKLLISDRKTTLDNAVRERTTIERVLSDIGCEEEFNQNDEEEDLELQLCKFRADVTAAVKRLEEAKRNWTIKHVLVSQLDELQQEMDRKIDKLPCNYHELIKQREKYNQYVLLKRKLDENTPHSGMSVEEIDLGIQDMNFLKAAHLKLANLSKLKAEHCKLEEYKKTHAVCLGECPTCTAPLSAWNGKLTVMTNETQNISQIDSEACEKKLNKLSAEISTLENLEKEMEEIQQLYEGSVDATKQLRYLLHIKQNDKIWEDCAVAKCDNPSDDDIKLAKDVELLKFNQKANNEKLLKLNTALSQLEPKLENVELLAEKVSRLSQSVQATELAIQSIETRKQWEAVRQLRAVEIDMQTKLPSAVRLSSLVKTAERVALVETLDNINLRAGIYLQRMLPLATASLVFEAKNTTEKIDLKISINGLASDINSLSGGEFARLVLAFAIAMAEMNNVDTLILDESFASLDSESTETVLDAIKENYFGKVIVIAHQTTKGVFDKVIEL